MNMLTHNDTPVITREWLSTTLQPLVRQFHDDCSDCGEDFLHNDEIFALLVSDLSRLIATSCEREIRTAQKLTGGTIEV
jgi:hypothetical protein